MKREISSLGNRVRCKVMAADAEIHGNLVKTQYIRLKGTVLQRLPEDSNQQKRQLSQAARLQIGLLLK